MSQKKPAITKQGQHSVRSFPEIHKYITMQEIERLYPTQHEASEQKFADTVNRRIRQIKLPA